MMKCNCGAEMMSELAFCSACGLSIADVLNQKENEAITLLRECADTWRKLMGDDVAALRCQELAVRMESNADAAVAFASEIHAHAGSGALIETALNRAFELLCAEEKDDDTPGKLVDLARTWIRLLNDRDKARKCLEAASKIPWGDYIDETFRGYKDLLGEEEALAALVRMRNAITEVNGIGCYPLLPPVDSCLSCAETLHSCEASKRFIRECLEYVAGDADLFEDSNVIHALIAYARQAIRDLNDSQLALRLLDKAEREVDEEGEYNAK